MFISKKKYEYLTNCESMVSELEKEVVRLAEQITAETSDCNMGPWCKDCRHLGKDIAQTKEQIIGNWYEVVAEAGEVRYCKKHLHEMCSEFEIR